MDALLIDWAEAATIEESTFVTCEQNGAHCGMERETGTEQELHTSIYSNTHKRHASAGTEGGACGGGGETHTTNLQLLCTLTFTFTEYTVAPKTSPQSVPPPFRLWRQSVVTGQLYIFV